MGWRPGQGIGDRVTQGEKKKAKDQHKVYGCYMPEEMRQVSRMCVYMYVCIKKIKIKIILSYFTSKKIFFFPFLRI